METVREPPNEGFGEALEGVGEPPVGRFSVILETLGDSFEADGELVEFFVTSLEALWIEGLGEELFEFGGRGLWVEGS